jgi:hypothetical protein
MTPAEVVHLHRKMTRPNSHRTFSMKPSLAMLLYVAAAFAGVYLLFWFFSLVAPP